MTALRIDFVGVGRPVVAGKRLIAFPIPDIQQETERCRQKSLVDPELPVATVRFLEVY